MAFVSVTLCVERINFMAACCADAPGKSSQTQFADFAETRLSTTNGHGLTRIRVRRGADGRNLTPPPSRCDAHIPGLKATLSPSDGERDRVRGLLAHRTR